MRPKFDLKRIKKRNVRLKSTYLAYVFLSTTLSILFTWAYLRCLAPPHTYVHKDPCNLFIGLLAVPLVFFTIFVVAPFTSIYRNMKFLLQYGDEIECPVTAIDSYWDLRRKVIKITYLKPNGETAIIRTVGDTNGIVVGDKIKIYYDSESGIAAQPKSNFWFEVDF